MASKTQFQEILEELAGFMSGKVDSKVPYSGEDPCICFSLTTYAAIAELGYNIAMFSQERWQNACNSPDGTVFFAISKMRVDTLGEGVIVYFPLIKFVSQLDATVDMKSEQTNNNNQPS